MNLRSYPLLTDENIHPEVVAYLRQRGHDVFDVREQGMAGTSDSDVLRLAHEQNRVVITHDRDFGRLVIAGGQAFVGIVYLRPGHVDPLFTIASLAAILDEALELRPSFIVVVQRTRSEIRVRIRLHER